MPKFKVYGGQDAYAVYSTIVEADTPDEAREIARDDRNLNWKSEDETIEFQQFDVFTDEGSVVPYSEEDE